MSQLNAFELMQAGESESTRKARFFASASHDIKQQLHVLGLFLDPLEKTFGEVQDPLVRRSMQGIQQSWRALDELLSQIMDLARLDAGSFHPKLESVDLNEILRALVLQHSAAAEATGVRLVLLSKPNRRILADELMLRRVVSNLVDNAIKFTSPGRTVAVTTRSRGGHWMIQVRDAGPGIAKALHGRIFEEFFQVESAGRMRQRGSGLGLAIVRGFVQQMNGQIEVRSRLGFGCCMNVLLPKAPPLA